MKKISVTLSPYKSPYYPIQARFKLNNVDYHLVFESIGQARNYFVNRFLDRVTIREKDI